MATQANHSHQETAIRSSQDNHARQPMPTDIMTTDIAAMIRRAPKGRPANWHDQSRQGAVAHWWALRVSREKRCKAA